MSEEEQNPDPMSEEREQNPNPMIYLCPDLVEEIVLGLPLNSILRFKTGSIYWLNVKPFQVLALDLHTQEFHNVRSRPTHATYADQLVNLDDQILPWKVHFRPVAVSKHGNVYLHDNEKRLLKYYPKTNLLRCISKDTWVISPMVENVLPLRPLGSIPKTFGYGSISQELNHMPGSRMSKFLSRIPTILFTTTLVSQVVYRYLS
ncbi:unnamed protein product [Arabidopsis thaliana]|nr:unnamed protein product [Arabidopsis thaliana]VYS55347.1 unnamed protein product [Arabidopsis thaliana]